MNGEKIKNYQATDLSANAEAAAKAAEAPIKSEGLDLEGKYAAPENPVKIETTAMGDFVREAPKESLSARGERIVKDTGEKLSTWKNKAGEWFGKAVETGGALFASAKERWNAGVQAVETGAWKLGQGMVKLEDAIFNGIDNTVNKVADTAKEVGTLAGNYTREAAANCRKDIEDGINSVIDLGINTLAVGAYATERAVNKFKFNLFGLKLGILKQMASVGTEMSERYANVVRKVEKEIALTSQLRDIASGKETAPDPTLNERPFLDTLGTLTDFMNARSKSNYSRRQTDSSVFEPFPTASSVTPAAETEPIKAPEIQDEGIEAAFRAEKTPEADPNKTPELRDEGIEAAFEAARIAKEKPSDELPLAA